MQTGAQEGAPRSAFVGAEPPKGVRLARRDCEVASPPTGTYPRGYEYGGW